MHAGEGDGLSPSFDVMPRVVYLPREGKVLDFRVFMLLDTAALYVSSYCYVCVVILLRMCCRTGPHTALYVRFAGARFAAVYHA